MYEHILLYKIKIIISIFAKFAVKKTTEPFKIPEPHNPTNYAQMYIKCIDPKYPNFLKKVL